MSFFLFNGTATPEIYTLSLHDALPICRASARGERGGAARARAGGGGPRRGARAGRRPGGGTPALAGARPRGRSEEHTSELQSHVNLVCRLLLEKKKNEEPSDASGTLRT